LICSFGILLKFGTGEQGLPDFPWYDLPKRGNMYKITRKYTTYVHTIHKIAVKHTNVLHYLHTRPSKIYPKWDFWLQKFKNLATLPGSFFSIVFKPGREKTVDEGGG
jgi:hypothetical protein